MLSMRSGTAQDAATSPADVSHRRRNAAAWVAQASGQSGVMCWLCGTRAEGVRFGPGTCCMHLAAIMDHICTRRIIWWPTGVQLYQTGTKD
jgi:hypothetical protein